MSSSPRPPVLALSSSSSAARPSGDEVTVLGERLLAPIVAAKVDALLLGCTHYPYLARVISDVVGPDVTLVSSADETAFAVLHTLGGLGLLRAPSTTAGTHRFLSSGDVGWFAELGARFLGPELARRRTMDPRPARAAPPRPTPTERTPTDDPTRRTRRRRAATDQLRA